VEVEGIVVDNIEEGEEGNGMAIRNQFLVMTTIMGRRKTTIKLSCGRMERGEVKEQRV